VQLPVISSLKTLRLRERRAPSLYSGPPSSPQTSSRLTKAVLGPQIHISSTQFLETLASSNFENLRNLHFKRLTYGEDGLDDLDRYQNLSAAMAKYLPNLEKFIFTNMGSVPSLSLGFGRSLIKCKKLETLYVDHVAFLPEDRGQGLLEPLSRCPAGLKNLRFFKMSLDDMELLASRYAASQHILSAERAYARSWSHTTLLR
jgi:hypothetical protein